MAILVTGGAGFIGSVELLNAGEDIVVMDNFYNSNSRALDGIRKITGKDFKFYEDDMLDIAAVDQIFAENDIEQVIHFAGYKCVPESVQKPLMYYSNNLRGTFNILETMKKYGCTKFVFSSSATVYGIPATVPVKEDFPLSAINPYGSTKLIIENLCREMYAADNTSSARIPTEFRTTSCRSCSIRLPASATYSQLRATTTPLRTAPACAIISTL